ncbi:MAG: hypothetical protein ABI864_02835 [Chloroflexota bacterium]
MAAPLLVVLSACSNAPGASLAPSSDAGQYPGWPGSGMVVGNTEFIPVLINTDLAVDTNRIMVVLQDRQGESLASAELVVHVAVYDLAANVDTPVSQADGTFRWLIPDVKAIYTAPAAFSHGGDWGLEVTGAAAGLEDRTARVLFSVRDTSQTPAIGAPAPASDTLTTTDPAALIAISTDTDPDLAFYALSIKQAIEAGKPFVVVFATPLFCTSGVCGPALDQVKVVAPEYVGQVNFLHVEPYVLQVKDGRTQPELDLTGYPKATRAVIEWGLPTEPYVFVVDAQGKVAAKFEGMAYPDELRAALDTLLP